MVEANKLVEYFRLACDDIRARGTIDARQKYELRPGQRQGYEALKVHLDRADLPDTEKLLGAFKMTVGLGKTGFFGALTDRVLQRAEADGHKLRVVIVAPKIELLEQTYNELTGFFPYLRGKVGIYGGNWPETGKPRRESNKDVTVISIPSWETLLDAGKLNADTVHIHLADESHRLTSAAREKRLDELLAHAVRFAFTATESFSEEKTVLNTHTRLIFEKGLVESVRDGESAAYIRAQHHVIRIDPPKAGEEFDPKRARQMGFINFVHAMLRTGTDRATGERLGFDEVTGDRLTDNQIGIYVGDTAQADKCAEILNDSPDLKRIAAQHHAEEFAVSIHTNGINEKQQSKLKSAYKTGECRALAGDELFKEGYNHPPMKVVVVMQTGSELDLEQIIGRGVRQWWNPKKKRYEGLTAISTTVYIGVDPEDPKDRASVEKAAQADERARLEALANSASAVDILEGNVQVFGPAARRFEDLPEPRKSGSATHRSFDGIQVTSYTSLEAVKTIHTEREKERKDLRFKDALIENQVVEWIRSTKEKTGKYPSEDSEIVWHKNSDGRFEIIEYETWTSINEALRTKRRGLINPDGSYIATSLPALRKKHGLLDDVRGRETTVEVISVEEESMQQDQITAWIKATQEKTGAFPSKRTKIVWCHDPEGGFNIVEGRTWNGINAFLNNNYSLSLANFRRRQGLTDEADRKMPGAKLTEQIVVGWIEATKHVTGNFPTVDTKTIWCKKLDGGFEVVVGETGLTIDSALRKQGRGLTDDEGGMVAKSLRDLKKKHGFIPKHLSRQPRKSLDAH